MKLERIKINVNQVFSAAQLAAILEVSAKKPGNVSPENDFSDTTYEDFLAGSLAIGTGIKESAQRGFLASKNEISFSKIEVGKLIKKCVSDVKFSHLGGNTHLGMVMLMVPIAAGVGMSIAKENPKNLRKNIEVIIKNSTLQDSLNFYEAVKIAKASGFHGKLKEPKVKFYQLMELSSEEDRIADELVNGLKITWQTFRLLEKNFKKIKQMRKAIIQTYLQILANFPDTLIAKKVGWKKAQKVSEGAKGILDLGGIFTSKGRKEIEKFALSLKTKKNELNPGTTADIIAAGIMFYLLKEGENNLL